MIPGRIINFIYDEAKQVTAILGPGIFFGNSRVARGSFTPTPSQVGSRTGATV